MISNIVSYGFPWIVFCFIVMLLAWLIPVSAVIAYVLRAICNSTAAQRGGGASSKIAPLPRILAGWHGVQAGCRRKAVQPAESRGDVIILDGLISMEFYFLTKSYHYLTHTGQACIANKILCWDRLADRDAANHTQPGHTHSCLGGCDGCQLVIYAVIGSTLHSFVCEVFIRTSICVSGRCWASMCHKSFAELGIDSSRQVTWIKTIE